jgi:hypothetical protein
MNDDKTLDNNKVHKLCTDIRVCLENNIDHISCDKTDIKEAGHANAPKVETLVCEVLEKNFKVAYETEKNNTKNFNGYHISSGKAKVSITTNYGNVQLLNQ